MSNFIKQEEHHSLLLNTCAVILCLSGNYNFLNKTQVTHINVSCISLII